jgi:hypothetical protein
MTDEKKNKPIFKVRCGGISASVFSNKIKGKDGKDFEVQTISIQKSYLDKEEKWQNMTIGIRKNDVAKLLVALNKVNDFVFLSTKDKEEADESDL